MIYRIREVLSEALLSPAPDSVEYTDSFSRASSLVEGAIRSRYVSIVQGPPGTGKTKVFLEVLRKLLKEGIPEGELLVYVAPTNELVVQVLREVVLDLARMGYASDSNSAAKMVRAYGSRMDFKGCENLNREVDRDTRIVITTEYQRVSGKHHTTVHFMIDEASRSLIHRPFITLSKSFAERIERGEGWKISGSINVVGDPMQAIVLWERYRRFPHLRRERLIIEAFVTNLLRLKGVDGVGASEDPGELMRLAYENLRGETFEMLDITYRIPSPSERPISDGYYRGILRARYEARDRLSGLWEGGAAFGDERVGDVAKIVESAITTCTPLIIAEPLEESKYEEFESSRGILFDPPKARVGILFALALALATRRKTCVIAPYREQVLHMKLECEMKYGDLMRKAGGLIRFSTVQKMLGSESDNVVAILGKEHSGVEWDSPTIYFQEPELFNVQVTRHKRVLVVVGDLRRLRREASEANQVLRRRRFEGIKVTADRMLELAGVSWDERLPRERVKREGGGAIYCRL